MVAAPDTFDAGLPRADSGMWSDTNRDVLWQLSVRAIEQRFKSSILGMFWILLTPLLLTGIYVLVFAVILPNPFDGTSQWQHIGSIVLGLAVFNLIAEPLNASPVLIVNNPNYVKKVVFPLEFLCIIEYSPAIVQFVVTTIITMAVLLFFHVPVTRSILAFPLILIPAVLFSLGLSFALAALAVFVRDAEHMVQHLTRIMLYTAAVFYPADKVPKPVWAVLRFNPLVHIVEQTRRILVLGESLQMMPLLYLWISAGVCFLLGLALFRRLKRQFGNVV